MRPTTGDVPATHSARLVGRARTSTGALADSVQMFVLIPSRQGESYAATTPLTSLNGEFAITIERREFSAIRLDVPDTITGVLSATARRRIDTLASGAPLRTEVAILFHLRRQPLLPIADTIEIRLPPSPR